jgi:prenyltransferase beta subunit
LGSQQKKTLLTLDLNFLRGTYCAIVVAKLTSLEELDSKLFENVAEWVVLCQTYEGGFGASPGVEAHGGYTFCGVASLKLLGKDCLFDVDSLLVIFFKSSQSIIETFFFIH